MIDLNDAVQRALSFVTRVIGAHITIEFAACEQAPHVHIDPSQVDQILMNLATNAADAMPNGGRLTISTSRQFDDSVQLTVADTGCGMPTEVARRAFEPFFTTKAPGKGTGLGLSIVARAVSQNGGGRARGVGPEARHHLLLELPARTRAARPARARSTPEPSSAVRVAES